MTNQYANGVSKIQVKRTPVEIKDLPFPRSFYRPHRGGLSESLEAGVSVDTTEDALHAAIQEKNGNVFGPITEIQIYYYAEDARLPHGPTTYIVTGEYPGSKMAEYPRSVLGFISPGI